MTGDGSDPDLDADLAGAVRSRGLDALADADLAILFDIWMGPNHGPDSPARAAAVVAAAAERGDERVAFASEFVQTILDDLEHVDRTSGPYKYERAMQMHSRAVGWERAEQIAWARVLFWRGLIEHDLTDSVIESLESIVAETASLPALDRFWPVHTLAVLLSFRERYAESLEWAVEAADVARAADNDPYQIETAINLSYIFLAVGDPEGAVPAMEVGLAAVRRGGWRPMPIFGSALEAYTLVGRHDDAVRLVEDNPWVNEYGEPAATMVRTYSALAFARAGQIDRAIDLAEAPLPDNVLPSTLRSRAWMITEVFLLAGQAERALTMVEEFLAAHGTDRCTPLDSTQIYRVLSEASEATGDPARALWALRESQAQCFTWVAESVVSRLNAIQYAAGDRWRARPIERHAAVIENIAHAAGARDPDLDDAGGRPRDGRVHHRDLTADEPFADKPLTDEPFADEPTGVEYVHYLTHDIRNSLQGVMGMISMLQLSNLDDKQRRYAEVADASAHTLLALCNDVLDLAQLNAGRLALRPEDTDVREAIRDVVGPIALHCKNRGVDVKVEVSPQVPSSLRVDPLRLKQVVLNLLTNAAKFTPTGSIVIELNWVAPDDVGGAGPGSSAGELRVTVSDTGRGIPVDILPNLFDEFAQVDPVADAAKGGTGLGLAIVGELVTLMGGQIEVDSTVGVGSRFSFTVPFESDLAAA